MRDKILQTYQFLITNFIISMFISAFYIVFTPYVNKLLSIIALISNTSIIYIGIFLLSLIFVFLLRNSKIIFTILILFFVILHSINLADLFIYNFFKYHINGLVINVILTPGGIEALDIPISNYIYFSLVIILLLSIEIYFTVLLLKKKKFIKFKSKYLIFFLIFFIILDKSIYAYLDSKADIRIRQVKKLYPLYLPFTCKKLLRKTFNIHVPKEYKLKINNNIKSLNYPLSPIKLSKKEQYPNIIWILLDAWRKDAFNKELTPNIYQFSKKSLVFKNHKSGGIATRFGVFSLFYGIYGTYWHKFLAEKRSPVFLDTLQKLNYNFKILASTKFTYPEFDQTIFINLHKYIPSKVPEGKTIAYKDLKITEELIKWIDEQDNSSQPFFSFLFLDGPHAKSFLPQFNKFKTKKNANYLIVGRKNVTVLKNLYLNAVLSDDYCVGKILNFIEKKGLLKNSIILISADHGEEFYEHGHVGHTSAFTPEQNDVPLILYIPNEKHKIFQKLTCHYDIVPTIMPLLGVTSPSTIYSNGINLLNQEISHKFIVASSWTNFAVIYPDYRFIFSLASYKAGLFEIRDNDFKIITNKDIFKSRIKDFSKVLKEISKF